MSQKPADHNSNKSDFGLSFRHLRVELQPNMLVRLVIDAHGSKVNVLSPELLDELGAAVDAIVEQKGVRGILVVSGKKAGFGAGADLSWISRLQKSGSREDIFELAERGKKILLKLERCPLPTVALIGPGDCLGGFAEVAFACQHRVAAYDELKPAQSARIGLPEVSLGLLPGLGGTVRAARLLGLQAAVEFVTGGKPVDGETALAKGLVDAVCPPERLIPRAGELVFNASCRKRAKAHGGGFLAGAKRWLMENTGFGRNYFRKAAATAIERKTRGAYPAPRKILDVILKVFEGDESRAFQAESEAFADLAMTREARNLVWLFLAKTAAMRSPEGAPAKGGVTRLGVVGAGAMGRGIAWQAAFTGTPVVLADTFARSLADAICHTWSLFQWRVDRGQLEPSAAKDLYRSIYFTLVLPGAEPGAVEKAKSDFAAELKAAAGRARLPEAALRLLQTLSRVEFAGDFRCFSDCDLIIEAVFEDLAVKQTLVSQVEEAMGDKRFFFASNTSSLKLEKIFQFARHPERTLGLHFFNPVERMPVCEVVLGAHTSDEAMAMGRAFIVGLKQVPIFSKDSNGFVVNRILGPYFTESTRMVWSGVSIQDIDRAAERFGMPMGPIELLDKVGHDIARFVFPVLEAAYGKRMAQPPLFDAIAHLKLLGVKGGKGFYLYDRQGKRIFDKKRKSYQLNPDVLASIPGEPRRMDEVAIQERLFLSMVNEAALCLEEGVALNAAEVDLGMILGTGWAPGRGGPLHFADSIGAAVLVDKLNWLAQTAGDNYRPCRLLMEMAASGKKFYD